MVKRWTHRSKLIVTCCLVFSLLASVMWAPQTGQAETELEKIRREIEAARERIEQAKENAQKAQSDLRKIQHEKEQVKEEINKLTEDIDKAVARLQQLEKNIEQQEAELRQTEERLQEIALRIQERDRLLRSRLRLMYTNGAVTYLEVLLQSTSFADFLDRFNLLKSLVSQDKEMLEAHERTVRPGKRKRRRWKVFSPDWKRIIWKRKCCGGACWSSARSGKSGSPASIRNNLIWSITWKKKKRR